MSPCATCYITNDLFHLHCFHGTGWPMGTEFLLTSLFSRPYGSLLTLLISYCWMVLGLLRWAICRSLKQFPRRLAISAIHQYTSNLPWRSHLLDVDELQAAMVRHIVKRTSDWVRVLLSASGSSGPFLGNIRQIYQRQFSPYSTQ